MSDAPREFGAFVFAVAGVILFGFFFGAVAEKQQVARAYACGYFDGFVDAASPRPERALGRQCGPFRDRARRAKFRTLIEREGAR